MGDEEEEGRTHKGTSPSPMVSDGDGTHQISSNFALANDDFIDGSEKITFRYHLRQCFSMEMFKSSYTRDLQLELLFSSVFALLGTTLIKFTMTIYQRDIPYQITQNSLDVIINLMYNNPFIERNDQTIPSSLLKIFALGIPTVVFLIGCIVAGWSMQRQCRFDQYNSCFSLLDGHSAICMFLIAVSSNRLFTEFIKRYVGYFRPNFYQMCEFDIEYGSYECTVNDEDGRKSFPSGHSSLSFCSMLCVALYLTGKVGLFHQWQGTRTTTLESLPLRSLAAPLWEKILALLTMGGPLMVSTFVAASRVHDDCHHPADVITGAVIGSSCALISYHLWYPPIVSSFAGFPYCAILPSQI